MKTRAAPSPFSYALVSVVRLQENLVGIGLILKARDRSTTKKISQALADVDVDAATYEALRIALEEAVSAEGGSFTFYLDNPRVAQQLTGQAKAKPALLGANLQVRAMMNEAGSVSVIPVTRTRAFSARKLAERAVASSGPTVREYVTPRLPLVLEDVSV
jgi:ribonuclease HI